jgi:hypothetical protein
MENKKNFSSLHHSIIVKINNKIEQSKKKHSIRKIKRGKNIIIFSKTVDGNLKLIQYFEYGVIKNVNKNIIVSHSHDLTTIYNSFINKIMDSSGFQ